MHGRNWRSDLPITRHRISADVECRSHSARRDSGHGGAQLPARRVHSQYTADRLSAVSAAAVVHVLASAPGRHMALDRAGSSPPTTLACHTALAVQPAENGVRAPWAIGSIGGLEATRQIKRWVPEAKVLVLTRHADEEYVFHVLGAGASGYVVKKAEPEELVSAIQAVYRGDSFLSPEISRTVIDQYVRQAKAMAKGVHEQLTGREREVLQLIAEGHSSREIAERLCISEKTVRTHRANLMHKLDLHGIAELTQYAVRKGLISLDS